MVLEPWDTQTANGHKRVFRIEIEVPVDNDPASTIARFHLERTFRDDEGRVLAVGQAGTWSINMADAASDPVTAEAAVAVYNGLETISLALYNKEKALLQQPEPDPET